MEDCSRSWRQKVESPFAEGGTAVTASWLEDAIPSYEKFMES